MASVARLPARAPIFAPTPPPPSAPPCILNADAVVIGGTATGSLTAAMLHHRGVSVTLVEPEPSSSTYDPVTAHPAILTNRALPFIRACPGLYDVISTAGHPILTNRFAYVQGDGSVKKGETPRSTLDPSVAIPMATLNEVTSDYAAALLSVTRLRADISSIKKTDDDALELTVKTTGGDMKTLTTRLAFVADGYPSRALEMLRAIPELSSRRGLGNKTFPSSQRFMRGIIFNSSIEEHVEDLVKDRANSKFKIGHDTAIVLRGNKVDGHSSWCSDEVVKRCGGRFMSFMGTRDSPFMSADSPMKMTDALKTTFPQLDLTKFIDTDMLPRFVAAGSRQVPGIHRMNSIVATLGRSEDAENTTGVVFLGSTAHMESLQLTLAPSTAIEDVGILAGVLDAVARDEDITSVLRRYEDIRLKVIQAIIYAVRNGSKPPAKGVNSIVWNLSNQMRTRLSKRMPHFFAPPIELIVRRGMPLLEVRRRSRRTHRRMFALVAIPIFGLVAVIKTLQNAVE